MIDCIQRKKTKQLTNETTSTATRTRSYGWRPDLPDPRDHVLLTPRPPKGGLPLGVDLRGRFPAVYDQGQLGSCTGNAIGAAVAFHVCSRDGLGAWTPSRLFIYYNERVLEHTVRIDAGAEIRDGIKSVAKLGCPSEDLWPYSDAVPGRFTKKPTKAVFAAATQHEASSYQRVPRTLLAMKSCLANAFPFVFGFTVFESFESEEVAKTGVVPMPDGGKPLGGHAVTCVGYDDATQRFIVRNSWGKDWGDKGYFTMPYEYLLNENLSDDFWTIRAVT